jgi:hypothetical protein
MNVTVPEGAPGREILKRELVNVTVTVVASARVEDAARAVPTRVEAIATPKSTTAGPRRSRAITSLDSPDIASTSG